MVFDIMVPEIPKGWDWGLLNFFLLWHIHRLTFWTEKRNEAYCEKGSSETLFDIPAKVIFPGRMSFSGNTLNDF